MKFKSISRIALMTWAMMLGVSVLSTSVPAVRMYVKG